jgi:hypothetical protein
MPITVALSSLKFAFVRLAISRARVVLPQLSAAVNYVSAQDTAREKLVHPGGPHRIMLPTTPFSVRMDRNESGPVRCAWPTNSSKVFGRSRSASGEAACSREATVVGLGRLACVE